MSLNKSAFSKHYKRIHIEGSDPEKFLNYCLSQNINVNRIEYRNEHEIILQVAAGDYSKLKEMSSLRYRISVSGEDGFTYRVGLMKKKKFMLIGLMLFISFILYQSMFIGEIEVSGYESYNEQELRAAMEASGFYEGCRKNINLDKVKLDLYSKFENISWIGIRFKGNLAQVTIAESGLPYKKTGVTKNKPCSIVADKAGYINSVDPEEGMRVVEDGQYVKPGDVIISGIIPLEKTTYGEADQTQTESCVHAAGSADARIPVRLNYYVSAYESIGEKTGRRTFTISVNDKELMSTICPYEISSVRTFTILNFAKYIRFKLQLNVIEEVNILQHKMTDKQVKELVINEIQKYVKEKLPDNAQILNKSLNFAREKNIIYIGVTLETLQQIGIEEEIIVDKSNRKSEKNDNQRRD